MLSVDDLVILPYTTDLTQAGIAYACQTLPVEAQLNRAEIFPHLRQLVIEQAAELAFRRHLSMRNVPHNLTDSSAFSGPARACAVLGGRCCDVFSYAIFHKWKIHQLHQDLKQLLSTSAPLSTADLSTKQRSDSDLVIISFVTGLVTANLWETKKAKSTGQPLHLVYPLPAIWSRRSSWTDLSPIACKSESNQPLTVTMVGQAEDRAIQTEVINLASRRKIQAQSHFYVLTYLQLAEMPSGRLGVHSGKLGKTLIIQSHEWGNIWVYGMKIYLAGWITRGELIKIARPDPSERSEWQPVSPSDKQLAIPVSELRPLEELFTKAIEWKKR